jgi:GTP-binding protein Era
MTESVPCGFVTVTGRANVGKSTLVNSLVGEKISITTDTPQTTRMNVRGILDEPESQLIFLDSPGLYKPRNSLGEHLLSRTRSSWGEGDVILFVFDAADGWGNGDDFLADELRSVDVPVLLIPNKIDLLENDEPSPESSAFNPDPWTDCVSVSAREGTNLKQLLEMIKTHLPTGPRLYPGDNSTDRSRRFRVAEIVREQAMRSTHQEVPHSIATVVTSMGPGDNADVMVIEATIYVERDSQRGILIGRDGNQIRDIGQQARNALTSLFDRKLYLDLTVEVLENWTGDRKKIRRIENRKQGKAPE